MLRTCLIFWFVCVVVMNVHSFQRLQQRRGETPKQPPQQPLDRQTDTKPSLFPPKVQDQIAIQVQKRLQWDSTFRRTKKCACPTEHSTNEEAEDVTSDVGEAAFSMLGSIWAEEGGIPTSLLFPNAMNDNGDVWLGKHQNNDLSRARIRELIDELEHQPHADEEADLDSVMEQILQ